MRIIIWTILFSISLFSFAQQYKLKGTVINESNMPVEATVCMLRLVNDSTAIQTVVTDQQGEFLFTGLANGDYIIHLQHMAYEKDTQAVTLSDADMELPPFVLVSLSNELNEIVVSRERPVVKSQDGKLIFDIPQLVKDKVVSNAFETLKNVPMVMGVDDDLRLAGASEYTILINGQITSMNKDQLISMLKSLPASRVANIEIMYSAPPQYNIRGSAINIVLKDQTADMPTLQGEMSAQYKQAHYDGYSGRGNLLYTKPKFNADLNINGYRSKGWGTNRMYAVHQFDNKTYDITQNNRTETKTDGIDLRLGMGYTFDNKDKLKFSYTQNMSWYESDPSSKTVFLENGKPYSNVISTNKRDGKDNLQNIKAEYNSHRNLNIGMDYTRFRDPSTERYSDVSNGQVKESVFKAKTEQKVDKALFFANHSTTLNKGWTLNYGGNFSYSKNDNLYNYFKNTEGQHADSVNNSKQKEYSGSVFAGFSKPFGEKITTQASVSANYFRATIDIMGKEKTLWNDFQPFFNANVSYTYSPQRILQLSFSSDIDYPPYWALSSDVFKINAYSSAQGNPELKFSKKYKTQLTYIMNQKYIFGAYYEHKPDRYIQLPYQSQNSLENIFQMINLDYEKQYGLFLVVPFKVEKIWDTRATINLIRQEEKDDDFYDVPYKRSMNSFVVNWTNTFNISSKPNIKLDVSGFYMHGALQGIYDIKKMMNVTTAAKYVFPDNNAELMFRVSDILKIDTKTKIDYMNQFSTMKMRSDRPQFTLSFIYRFGNYKKPKVEEVDTSRFGR